MESLKAHDPRHIGAYRLLGRLGEGGMGRVFLARSERGRTVAVKLVQEELAGQEEFRIRFRQEVRAARRVGGKWTAPVLDADTEAGVPWVATGYVAGPSLQSVVSESAAPLPARTVRILASGLARALQAVHGAGLVHRDLKPSNVLITIDGPRVIDFGIARALAAVTDGAGGPTRTGATVGSPGFMSPEQVRGEPITPASDVFSLGSVLAYAATGRLPFGTADSGVHALLYRIAQEEPDLTGVPDELRELVADCLAKNPSERPTPAAILARTGAEGVAGGTASGAGPGAGGDEEPWLPGALVARLGRHAVELLEAENPAGGTDGKGAPLVPPGAPGVPAGPHGHPSVVPPPAAGAAASGAVPAGPSSGAAHPLPPVDGPQSGAAEGGQPPPSAEPPADAPPAPPAVHGMATVVVSNPGAPGPAVPSHAPTPPPSYGYPHTPAAPPAYGYPNAGLGQSSPGRPYAQPHPSPYAPTAPEPRPHRGRAVLLTVLVVLLAAVGAASSYFLLGGTDGQDRDQARASASGDAPDGSSKDSPQEGGSAGPADASDGIPESYLGGWTASVGATGTDTSSFTLVQGAADETVFTLVAQGPDYYCEFEAALTSAGPPVELGPSTVTQKSSDTSCQPGPATTIEMTSDGRLRRTFSDDSKPPMTYSRQE